ncbi:hypothetical protein ACKWTF_002887 [Chironomus riparius]
MIYFCNIFFTLFKFLLPLFIIMLSPFPSFSLLLLILLLHVYVPIKKKMYLSCVILNWEPTTSHKIQNEICNLSNRVQKSIHIHFYPSFFSQKKKKNYKKYCPYHKKHKKTILYRQNSHEKRCVQILKSSRQITMTVRGPTSMHGFGPPASATDVFKSSPMTGALLSPPSRQTCSWIDRHGRPASPPYDFEGRRSDRHERVRRVELVIEPGQSLGLMIRGGIEYGLGIYVTGVDKDSVADRAGLSVGDQILEVNGQSFMNVTHDEAVNQFKFHKRMSLVVRDVGKVPHSCTTIEPEPWDVGRRKCPVSAMVEEKARSLLPRHQFSNLSFYINEYGARGLTVDAFVSILLEMLDTPEKHTLVTEIRELIFPEDRPRYDELVYRRSKLSSRMDYYDSHRLYNPRPRRGSDSLSRLDYDSDQSMQRLPTEDSEANLDLRNHENLSHIVPDENGNLFITVRKTKAILGIAMEGGANTKHPLPRIINIHEHGAAYEAGGLEVGQLILEVDNTKVEGMQHQDVARLIAECYANRDRNEITFLVVEAKKSNLEPKPTALVFLEQ